MKKIKTVSIIGVGLIGGSIGMALKKQHLVQKVIGIGRHPEKLKLALKLKAVDEISTDFSQGVKEADLVVIATPVSIIIPTLKKILPHLKKGCIVTDVGSVKEFVVKQAEKLVPKKSIFFVAGHPMAGSEQQGVKFAHNRLFKKATWILTPTSDTSKVALNIVKKLCQKMGANVLLLKPVHHDELVAATSHLPHLIAASLVKLVTAKDKNISKIVAGSFKDLTRIASSSPWLWTDICLVNRLSIVKTGEEFKRYLNQILRLLKEENPRDVLDYFNKSKKLRDKIVNNN